MSSFGDRLKEAIDDRGTSQADVARHAGISAASVSDWATDTTQADKVKALPLLRAAAFLHVDPLWLLTGKGYKREPVENAVRMSIVSEEPPAAYLPWPFKFIDRQAVAQLKPHERAMIEGAWISTAQGLGFALALRNKPDERT